MYKLCRYYQILGRFEAAQKAISEACSIRQGLLGDEHPTTLSCRHRLGQVYVESGMLDEAASTHRNVLSLRQKVLHGDNIQTLESIISCGWILALEREYGEAEVCLLGALKSLDASHSPEARETIVCMNYLGEVLREQGKLPEAANIMQRALDVCKSVHGSDHSFTVYNLYNLGLTLEKLGKYREAQKLFQETLKLAPLVLGKRAPAL